MDWLGTREGNISPSRPTMSNNERHHACVGLKHPGTSGVHYYYGATCLEALREAYKADEEYCVGKRRRDEDEQTFKTWWGEVGSASPCDSFITGLNKGRETK